MSNERPLAVGDLVEIVGARICKVWIGRQVTVVEVGVHFMQGDTFVERDDGVMTQPHPKGFNAWRPEYLRRIDPPSTDFTACDEEFKTELGKMLKGKSHV